jgi:hypothetical protein
MVSLLFCQSSSDPEGKLLLRAEKVLFLELALLTQVCSLDVTCHSRHL